MREMKDSGLRWIDQIPIEWQTARIKGLFDFGKGLPITKENLTETGVRVISYGQIHSKKNNGIRLFEELYRFVPNTYLSTNPEALVKKGDFIFADTSEDFDGCGNCVYVNEQGLLFAGYHTIIFRSNHEQDNSYLAYLFRTDAWRSQIRERVTGVKLFSISRKILADCSVILPPTTMQSRIVAYLDCRCATIDALIANQQQQIDKLKQYKQAVITEAVTHGLDPDVRMKDSGVEWIGEVPEHWDIRKVSTIASRIVVGVVVKPANYFAADGTIPFLRGMNIKDYQIDIQHLVYITPETNRMLAKSIVHENDILVVRDGNIGASCVVPKDLDGSNVVSMIIVTVNADVSPQYICYCLNSRVGKNQFELSKIGSALTHTSVAAVSALQFALPTTEEQKTIVSYLETKCAQIDALIVLKQQKADKLAQYKKSLIYEVVTGKREI